MSKNLLVLALLCACALPASGGDWPTYRKDAARSGIASEPLAPPLHAQWVFQPRHAPKPAWPAPARHDYFHKLFSLSPAVTYDRAFHVSIAEGLVYFGSSADDGVYALDAATGAVRWSFHTRGPVRLAPTYASGRVYFGSDDGRVYCLDAQKGTQYWSWRPPGTLRLIPGNGRLVSDRPVRSGVLVKDGFAYVCAGIFPTQTVYICALNAETGTPEWIVENDAVSPQGYLLASESFLFVPTGRTNPQVFARATGKDLGTIEGNGGTFALLTGDHLLSGPGRDNKDAVVAADTRTRESLASFPGTGLVVDGHMAYLQSAEGLTALDRARHVEASIARRKLNGRLDGLSDALKEARDRGDKEQTEKIGARIGDIEARLAEIPAGPDECAIWRTEASCPYGLILAGDTLFAGGDGFVIGVRAEDGEEVWKAPVSGRAYGLALADGRLYVSTDAGTIHCFAPAEKEAAEEIPQPEAPLPYGDDPHEARAAARELAQGVGIDRGYALLIAPPDLSLACGLIEETHLGLALVMPDPIEAACATEKLAASGRYGDRASVWTWEDMAALPVSTGIANLVIVYPGAAGQMPVSAAEAVRVARPFGGTVVAGATASAVAWFANSAVEATKVAGAAGAWLAHSRGPVPGAGEWTQLYADAGHTACSHDTVRGPFAVQWFGQPGPRPMVDRHHRPMASLFKGGRLFVTGDNRVITVDAYNGAPLWEREVPDSRRIGALKNAGHQLVAEETLHVLTGNDCWLLDVATGDRRGVLNAPKLVEGPQEWGYLNFFGDLLLGSAQFSGASFTEQSIFTCSLLEGDYRPVIISQALFAVDRETGGPAWTLDRGAYMNTAMALAGERFCFIEARGAKAREDEDGRMRIDEFLEDETRLAAVDASSGTLAWERTEVYPFEHILFISATPDVVLVSGTYNKAVGDEMQVFYHLFAYRAGDGEPMWDTSFRAVNIRGTDFTAPGGTHGENWQHPVILGSTVYARPYAFDLATGEKKDYMLYRGGHGCGGLTASAHYLYGRGGNPRAYPTDVTETKGIALTRASRPGCWLNIIPAGGLVLIPESSSGCTCAYPIQTSLALAPHAWAFPKDPQLAGRRETTP